MTFIHTIFNNLYPKQLGLRIDSINTIQKRIDELKNKKNKTVEEQLEFIELKKSGMNKFNFSPTSIIKLIIFIFLYQLFRNKLLLIFLGVVFILFNNLIIKKNNFGKILFDIENYFYIFIFFKMLHLFGFILVFVIIFICNFLFNIFLKEDKNENIKKNSI